MKHTETQKAGSAVSGALSAHGGAAYQRVLDGRKQAIRGLWRRNDRFYAQLSIEDPATGVKRPKRVPLFEDEERKVPAGSVAEAKKALERLRVQREDDALPVLKRTPTFAAYVKRYGEHMDATGDLRPATVAKLKASLRGWSEFLGEIRLDRFQRRHAIAYREQLGKDGLSPRTVNLHIVALRGMLRLAMDEGLIHDLPVRGLKALKWEAPKRGLFTAEDIEALCDAAFQPAFIEGRLAREGETGKPLKNAQMFADYIRLMAACGSRRDETLRLRWSDVDFDRGQLTIGSDGLSKNREARAVDFNASLEAHLKAMKARRAPDSEWLFPSPQRGDQDASTKTFRESLALAKALAAKSRPALSKFGFHDCRHHFVSFAVMSGVDFMTVAKWVGHKDGGVLIGKVYGHLADSHRKAMAAKLVFSPQIVTEGQAAAGL